MSLTTNFENKNVTKVPAGACYRYWDCGNVVPGGNESKNELCNECIDWVRSGGRGHELPEQLDSPEDTYEKQ